MGKGLSENARWRREEKNKMKAEMDKAIDWFYGKITIERVDYKDDNKSE